MTEDTNASTPGGVRGMRILERYWRLEDTELVALCSLCLFVLHGLDHVLVQTVAGFALLAFVIDRTLCQRWWFWAPIALASTLALIRTWDDTGNHQYVITYWMWVMTLAFVLPNRASRAITGNARFLIVFVFLLAVFQKLASDTYLNGEMFEMKILRSEGFNAFAVAFGIAPATLADTAAQIDLLRSATLDLPGDRVLIPSTDEVRTIALWMTWYDLIVQVMIGLAFLVRRRTLDMAGHGLLLFFILTAYFWVQITAFGWVIAVMGLALARRDGRGLDLAYFGCLFALVAFHLPWGAVLARMGW